jgi:RNA polymerase sigma-70 factor (ECF subfamily)
MGTIVMRHQAMLLRTAFRLLHDWSLAEDIVQEAFLRAYQHACDFKPTARLTTWLYRIVCNLCLDEMRRSARRPPVIAMPSSRDPEDGLHRLLDRERADRVANAVARLPERQRVAVVLHRYEGLSMRDVAESLGWSESAVESCLVRAYARLRVELADLMPKKSTAG